MTSRQLVLVGGGRAHLHVLRELARRPVPDLETTVVAAGDHHHAAMVPGFLQGRYELDDLRFDLPSLVRRAGARLVAAEAERVDVPQRVVLAGGERVPFDVCSLDVGCDVAGLDTPGVAEHAVVLRPVARVVELRERLDALAARGGRASVVIVGGGVAAVEVALALRHRLGATGSVSLVEAGVEPVPELDATMRRLATAILRERGVSLALGGRVAEVGASAVVLRNGATLPADLVVWMPGAAAPALVARSGLTSDEQGHLLVDRSLRAADGAPLWGAGGCVAVKGYPDAGKGGAYARREPPTLDRSLRAALGQGRPGRFRPQRSRLTLLDTGGGWALMCWKGIHRHSRWAWRLKDMIDRRLVRHFRGSDEKRGSAS